MTISQEIAQPSGTKFISKYLKFHLNSIGTNELIMVPSHSLWSQSHFATTAAPTHHHRPTTCYHRLEEHRSPESVVIGLQKALYPNMAK